MKLNSIKHEHDHQTRPDQWLYPANPQTATRKQVHNSPGLFPFLPTRDKTPPRLQRIGERTGKQKRKEEKQRRNIHFQQSNSRCSQSMHDISSLIMIMKAIGFDQRGPRCWILGSCSTPRLASRPVAPRQRWTSVVAADVPCCCPDRMGWPQAPSHRGYYPNLGPGCLRKPDLPRMPGRRIVGSDVMRYASSPQRCGANQSE